ncbi:hypothetical protein ZWY2020_025385 [Hordeum vulgare]|nr:hypothetical protein ZWY2020_025385 [Hordeum vulgare]
MWPYDTFLFLERKRRECETLGSGATVQNYLLAPTSKPSTPSPTAPDEDDEPIHPIPRKQGGEGQPDRPPLDAPPPPTTARVYYRQLNRELARTC